jgi:hypothetical protein
MLVFATHIVRRISGVVFFVLAALLRFVSDAEVGIRYVARSSEGCE